MTQPPVIVVTLYRRPDATRRLLESLGRCYGVDECAVYLSCDYAPEHANACHAVSTLAVNWEILRNLGWSPERQTRTQAVEHEQNLGVDLHKLWAIPRALEWSGADSFIFLEDDTTLSPDALNYFATTLAETESDPAVLAVCGFNRIPDDNQGPEDVDAERAFAHVETFGTYRHPGFKPWGWAMTAKQWDRFFGDGGQRYRAEVDNPNGRFDWWLTDQCRPVSEGGAGMVCVRTYLARTAHGEWADAEHTPSFEHWRDHERVTVGAWCFPELPDHGLLNWGKQ